MRRWTGPGPARLPSPLVLRFPLPVGSRLCTLPVAALLYDVTTTAVGSRLRSRLRSPRRLYLPFVVAVRLRLQFWIYGRYCVLRTVLALFAHIYTFVGYVGLFDLPVPFHGYTFIVVIVDSFTDVDFYVGCYIYNTAIYLPVPRLR